MADTLDYLLSIDAITGSTACAYRAAAMAAGAAAVRDGYDRTHGGIYESNGSKAKVWWVQAEAMLGAWKLHQYYGDNAGASAGGNSSDASGPPSYLKVLADTARFLKQHQTDGASGEQFWQVRVVVGNCKDGARGSLLNLFCDSGAWMSGQVAVESDQHIGVGVPHWSRAVLLLSMSMQPIFVRV